MGVASGVGVSVGGMGVKVTVGVGDGVGVQLGVKVNVGRGVLVGSEVGVGAWTRSLPTEQPRLIIRINTNSQPANDLDLISRLNVPFNECTLLLLEQDKVPNPLTGVCAERQ